MNENMSDYEARPEDGAVNVYGNDMSDEFPILKAFQEYVDAEQAKSRKRMLLLCVFFSFILCTVIGVFVVLLIASGARIQTLNDRLVDLAMKERGERIQTPTPPAVTPTVVPTVVPVPAEPAPQKQDDSVLRSLAEKLEHLQKTIFEEREQSAKLKKESAEKADRQTAEMEAKLTAEMEAKLTAERTAKLAAEQAAKLAAEEAAEHKRQKSVESAEVERLKHLLAAEKEKVAFEQQRVAVEQQRVKAEQDRVKAEQERIAAERQKVAMEKEKVAAEKEKVAAEREKQRQAELEAYRRKQYPDLYEQKKSVESPSSSKASRMKALAKQQEEADREIDEILKDIKPMKDDDESAEETTEKTDLPAKTPSADQAKKQTVEKSSSVGSWKIPEE